MLHQPREWGKMFLTCREGSVWLCEPGAALQPELPLYEPTDTTTLEHVVLIGSRARPRPVKAPVHNDRSLYCSNENHMPDQTQASWSQSLFSVMSCLMGSLFPSLKTMALYSFKFFRQTVEPRTNTSQWETGLLWLLRRNFPICLPYFLGCFSNSTTPLINQDIKMLLKVKSALTMFVSESIFMLAMRDETRWIKIRQALQPFAPHATTNMMKSLLTCLLNTCLMHVVRPKLVKPARTDFFFGHFGRAETNYEDILSLF